MADPITFDLPKEQFPKGWGKSARETKSNFLQDQVNAILGGGYTEAKRLNAEEEKRGASMQGIIEQALPQANAPTWTPEAIATASGAATSSSANDFLGGMGSLRSYLGGAGITGGGQAAGLASNLELSRLGQITDSKRAVYLQVQKDQALDRARNFQNSLVYANAVNRTPSSVYMQFLGDAAGIRLAQQGNEAQRSAAKDAANASKQAGWMQFAGAVGGAAIGAL